MGASACLAARALFFGVSLLIVSCAGLQSSRAAAIASNSLTDLEARIEELENSTSRKGNRAVSLQIYGQVNKALLIWDDGLDSDAYVVDNDSSSTRFGLLGEGQITPGWFAGYRIEVEVKTSASDEVYNLHEPADPILDGDFRLRHSYVYIENDRLGRISVGHQSPATDDITIINLGASMSDAALHYNNNFGLRLDFGGGATFTTDLTWGSFAHTVDALRGEFIRYDSPSINGFILSSAWGEDDVWDVALRYAGNWDALQVAAGAGYFTDIGDFDIRDFRGSFSVLHKETGLFLTGAAGLRDDETAIVGDGADAYFYFTQVGVKRRFLPYGATTFYAEYGQYYDYSVGQIIQADLAGGNPNDPFVNWGKTDESQIRRLGFGVEQAFDSSGLLLYAQYQLFEADIYGSPCPTDPTNCAAESLTTPTQRLPVEDWSAVIIGARVQF